MFFRDILAVDINTGYIKMLYGNKNRIKLCGTISTPEDSVQDGKIINFEAVGEAVNNFLLDQRVNPKYMSFVISGQDVVMKNIETPILDEKNLRQSVEWEMSQFLPGGGMNYYIDYEKLQRVVNSDKKVYKILAAAAPKDRVDSYVELSRTLNKEILSIDMYSNCLSRTFRHRTCANKSTKSLGIIYVGYRTSRLVIINEGNLFMDKEIPFGYDRLVMEISSKLQIAYEEAHKFLTDKFNFNNINEENEVEKRLQSIINSFLIRPIQMAVQFYGTGRVDEEKNLNEICITGPGCDIPGLETGFKNYFPSPVFIIDSAGKLGIKTKLPKDFDFKLYIAALGLLLRKE